MDYATEVWPREKWRALPSGKIRLVDNNPEGIVEGVWVKKLPNGNMALDNMPLNPNYEWQDVLNAGHEVVARRWHNKVYFTYKEPEGEEGLALRRKIIEAITLKNSGYPGFWSPGVGYCLFESENREESESTLREVLAEIGLDITLASEEEE